MILILTPLAIERAALEKVLPDLIIEVAGHGKVQFALGTQLMVQKHRPELVICAGAAGALDPSLRLLDVVVATATVEHDFKLRFGVRPLPSFPGAVGKLGPLEASFTTHFGLIASGDEDIVDPERAEELRMQTGALAVAWEGAGGARACQLQGVPFLEIRAITDSADRDGAKDFARHVEPGMAHVANVIQRLL